MLVREGIEGRYVLVAGVRRWRASVEVGRPTVSAVVVAGWAADGLAREFALVEDLLRERLGPIERAQAFRTLMSRNGWNASRLALALHVHRGTVSRSLKLLELPDDLKAEVESGRIAPSVARSVARTRRAADRYLAGVSTLSGPSEVTPGLRRVVWVAGGRVTVDLARPGGRDCLADALAQAYCAVLRAKADGSDLLPPIGSDSAADSRGIRRAGRVAPAASPAL